VLAEGLRAKPSDVGLLCDMAELQFRLGRQENLVAAADLFDRAVRLMPQPIVRRNLGFALWRLGRHAEAAAQLELASRGDPTDGRARLLWAKVLRAQGRFNQASPLTLAGLELLAPELEVQRRELGSIAPGDPFRRERESKLATLELQVGEAFFELGGDAARRRDWLAAQAYLAEAVRLLPQSAQVRAAWEHARSQTQGPKSP
jgi:tetratricopeptide (TPR) repeat protein